MAVSISESSKGVLSVGLPRSLFKTPGFVAPESDGQRFLFLAPVGYTSTPPITVIINWADQEKQACGDGRDAKQRPSRQ